VQAPADLPSALPSGDAAAEESAAWRWFVRLRWLAAGAQALLLASSRFTDAPVPMFTFVVPAAVALSNLWVASRRPERGSATQATLLLAFDTVLLAVLLAATGGVSNPFTIFFLVHITLAALVLPSRATWGIAALSVVLFGALFAFSPSETHAHPEAPRLSRHLRGMWLAFFAAALATAALVGALRRALERREREIRQLRARQERDERLATLSTLAGGAAHELATPLATIGVVVGELRRALEAEGAAEHAEELAIVAGELARCRAILDEMAARSGEAPGERVVRVAAGVVAAAAIDRLESERRGRVELVDRTGAALLEVPAAGTARAIESLLRNALDASPAEALVVLEIAQRSGATTFEVRDRGAGMDAATLRRAGEPFFTTKGTGRGLGLGLFVTRAFAEHLGGRLDLESHPSGGTLARLSLPHHAEVAR
jgi:two-component system sensor histidine kinase RegB